MKALLAAVVLVAGCATSGVKGGTAGPPPALGWDGDDVFRASGSGVPPMNLNDEALKRERAQEAAVLLARTRVVEEFARLRAGEHGDVEAATAAVTQELGELIRGGKVVRATFDEEMTSEVIYEVSGPGLRQRVESGARKNNALALAGDPSWRRRSSVPTGMRSPSALPSGPRSSIDRLLSEPQRGGGAATSSWGRRARGRGRCRRGASG